MNAQETNFKCPQCNQAVNIDLGILLSRFTIYCQHCGLKLNLDKGKSSSAINALGKFQKAQEQMEAAKNQHA